MNQALSIRIIPDLTLWDAPRDYVFGVRAKADLEKMGYEVIDVKFSKTYEHYKGQKIKGEFGHFRLKNYKTNKIIFKKIEIKRGC